MLWGFAPGDDTQRRAQGELGDVETEEGRKGRSATGERRERDKTEGLNSHPSATVTQDQQDV